MRFNGLETDIQETGFLLVGVTLGDQLNHAMFPLRQTSEVDAPRGEMNVENVLTRQMSSLNVSPIGVRLVSRRKVWLIRDPQTRALHIPLTAPVASLVAGIVAVAARYSESGFVP
jgi:hypothetical protein